MVGRTSPLARDVAPGVDAERRAAEAAIVGGIDGSVTDDGVSTRTYDRVVRVVSWVFLLTTTAIVAATGLWPETQPAIFVLLAFAGLFVVIVHELLPPDTLGPAKFVVEGSRRDHGRDAARGADRRRRQPVLLRLPADRRWRRAGRLAARSRSALAAAASIGYILAVARRFDGGDARSGGRGHGRRQPDGPDPAVVRGDGHRPAQRRTRDAAIRLSTVDSLTGLFNRTFFFAAIDREIARSARSGRGFCLLMMDLDELKSINDRVGHFHGDRVLRGVGEVITARRPPDRHRGPLRRRRVRGPPARDRSDRCLRAGREDPARGPRDGGRPAGRLARAVAVDRRRQPTPTTAGPPTS